MQEENLLFVCTANLQRSPTAAELFNDNPNYNVKSCGTRVFQDCDVFLDDEKLLQMLAGTPCNEDLIDWADVIFCMEYFHKQDIIRQFPQADNKKIEVLHIPDDFCKNDKKLIKMLKEQLKPWLDKE